MPINTYQDLYGYAKTNGLVATKKLLREYVEGGQPNGFMEGFTTRAMCRCAGHGLDGDPIDDIPSSYLETTYGSDLYFYMWGAD